MPDATPTSDDADDERVHVVDAGLFGRLRVGGRWRRLQLRLRPARRQRPDDVRPRRGGGAPRGEHYLRGGGGLAAGARELVGLERRQQPAGELDRRRAPERSEREGQAPDEGTRRGQRLRADMASRT